MTVIDRLDITQQLVGQGSVEAFHDRVLPRTLNKKDTHFNCLNP